MMFTMRCVLLVGGVSCSRAILLCIAKANGVLELYDVIVIYLRRGMMDGWASDETFPLLQVELHCAAGFEELDNALRRALAEELTPEQLTALLQGTAGLYQDLRMDIKKRMKVFEEYALAEILQIPPGLLANPVDNVDPTSSSMNDEEENKLDEELKTLQLEISEGKQRGRDIKATTQYLEMLLKDVRQKLIELENVPNVVGSTETLEKDVQYISNKGAALEEGVRAIESLQGTTVEDAGDVDKTIVAAMQKSEKTGMVFCVTEI